MVTLKPHDLNTLIEITQLIVDYKSQALSQPRWDKFYNEYLPSLLEQLSQNQFKCHRPDDSTFTWIIDQLCHSRKIVPGVSHKEGIPLADTVLGERALAICRAATRGQKFYDSWRRDTKFNDLFEI
jgi:hypothetical protein